MTRLILHWPTQLVRKRAAKYSSQWAAFPRSCQENVTEQQHGECRHVVLVLINVVLHDHGFP